MFDARFNEFRRWHATVETILHMPTETRSHKSPEFMRSSTGLLQDDFRKEISFGDVQVVSTPRQRSNDMWKSSLSRHVDFL